MILTPMNNFKSKQKKSIFITHSNNQTLEEDQLKTQNDGLNDKTPQFYE